LNIFIAGGSINAAHSAMDKALDLQKVGGPHRPVHERG
jgi:hypothetical protein